MANSTSNCNGNVLTPTPPTPAGQQAQGQADHAGPEAQHALHGPVRLAGIGGPEDGGDPALAFEVEAWAHSSSAASSSAFLAASSAAASS